MHTRGEEELECADDDLIELSSHKASSSSFKSEEEEDVLDDNLLVLLPVVRQKSSDLPPPPPVAPRKSRQNSACDNVQYTSLNPLPIAPGRRRRVIKSILLHIQRKEKTIEKIVDVLKGMKPTGMYELGLEFLRIYNGKFNYPQGHILVMCFRKKIWFLTIREIEYVDCSVGDIEPRSVLILNYKNQLTSVQI